MVRLVGEEEATASKEGEAEAGATASEEAMEALATFLPQNLCDRLGLSDENLVELSRVLAPSVRKRAEKIRQSL